MRKARKYSAGLRENLGQQFYAVRLEKKMFLSEVSQKSKITPVEIENLEMGVRIVQLPVVLKLADFYGKELRLQDEE